MKTAVMEKYDALPAERLRQVELVIDMQTENIQDEDDDEELYLKGEAAYNEWVADGKPTLSLEEAGALT